MIQMSSLRKTLCNNLVTSRINNINCWKLGTSLVLRHESIPLAHTDRRSLTTSSSYLQTNIQRSSQIHFNYMLKSFISCSGRDRVKYAYRFNRHKQHKSKNKKTHAEKEAIKAKLGFKLDTTKPLSELLKYSDKFYTKRGPQSNRSYVKKYQITQFGKPAIPDAAPRATEVDADGYPVDIDLEVCMYFFSCGDWITFTPYRYCYIDV